MGGWFGAKTPVSYEFGPLEGAPLVRINANVADEFFTTLGNVREGYHALAGTRVQREVTSHPTVIYYVSARAGFSEKQLRIWGHEASHAMASLLALDRDPTHDTGETL